jgi:hypothetical protein
VRLGTQREEEPYQRSIDICSLHVDDAKIEIFERLKRQAAEGDLEPAP